MTMSTSELMPNQLTIASLVGHSLNENWPVLLEGSTGCGKNVLIEHLAKARNKRVVRLNLNVNVTQEDIWGQNTLIKEGESSIIKFKYGPAVNAIRDGHWLLLDEVNAALPEVLFSLHALLERSGATDIYIPILQESITRHPDFRIVATMNPVDEYFGVRNLNQAFLNRFMIFQMRSPTLSEISQLYTATVHKDLIKQTILILRNFCTAMKKFEIDVKYSVRDVEKLMTYIACDKSDDGIEAFVRYLYADAMKLIPPEKMKELKIKSISASSEEADVFDFFATNYEKCKAVFKFMTEIEAEGPGKKKT